MRYAPDMTPASGAWKGVVLGLLNTFVIGLGLAATDDAAVLVLVLVFGALPGMGLGLVLGFFAGAFPKAPVPLRLGAMIVPSLVLVYALASEFQLQSFIALAMIPTAVAVLILERWTRWREAPPLPLAQVA